MIDPTQFDRLIDTAFMIATSLYGVIGFAGMSSFPRRSYPFAHFGV